jgi:hypothetical protein
MLCWLLGAVEPEDPTVAFVVNGQRFTLSRAHVQAVMESVSPEPIQSHAVLVGRQKYPVKQVFALTTGLDRLDFTSSIARRQLGRLGFQLTRE